MNIDFRLVPCRKKIIQNDYKIGSCVLSSPPFVLHADFVYRDMILFYHYKFMFACIPPLAVKVYIFWKEIS